ncbi:response regulator [Salinimonas sediminis]|uniref:Response regulator n=2 Tax=Salinimonas sediminis TaxID=2303538 RepID=A0A346NPX6_9ALTE|nr:response regulator [Salinimonas sediminis]
MLTLPIPQVKARMTSQSIVVIDDDVITLELIVVALEQQLGAHVHSFTHSKLARAFLLKQSDASVSLVVSDQMMPDYDGIALLNLCRRQGMQVPFLLLTADATRATVLKARQSGANQFMVKPFKVENLLDNVRKLLAS